MEIFEEVKNRYMHIAFKVLNECQEGISEDQVIKIVEDEEFEEKLIGNNFHTFEGLLLNRYSENENFNILKESEGFYYPNVKKESNGPMVPVRLTNLEKAWLKNMIQDKRLKVFLGDTTIEKLKNSLKDFHAPIINELIDTTNGSMASESEDNEQFEENFRSLLKAIKEEKVIRYRITDKCNNYLNKCFFPIRLEYSLKTGEFRVSMYSI